MAKECKWILKEPADPAKVDQLSAELGIDRVLSELLVKRGVETFEQIVFGDDTYNSMCEAIRGVRIWDLPEDYK